MQFETLSALVQKVFLISLNFVDDIAIALLSQMGFGWVWLQWLSTALMVVTLTFWSIRLLRYCHRKLTASASS